MQANKSHIRETLLFATSLFLFALFLFYLRSVQRLRLHRRRLQRWKQETRALQDKQLFQQQQQASRLSRQTQSPSIPAAASPKVRARLDRKPNGSIVSNLNAPHQRNMTQTPSSRPFASLGRSSSGKLSTLAHVQSPSHAQQSSAQPAPKLSAVIPTQMEQDESVADGGDGGGSSAASRVEAWRNELADVTTSKDGASSKRARALIPMAMIVASRKKKRGHESEEEDEDDGAQQAERKQASEAGEERMAEDDFSDMEKNGEPVSGSIQRTKKRRMRSADEEDQAEEDQDDEEMDAAARPTIKRNMSGPRGVKRSAEESTSPAAKSARRRAYNEETEASEADSVGMDEDREEEGEGTESDVVDTSMEALSTMPDTTDMSMDESMIASPIKRQQLREARLNQSENWKSRLEAAADPKKVKSRKSMQSVLPSKIRLPGDGPRKNTHRVETLDWMQPGDDAEDLEGIKWRMDDDGRLRRLEHVRSLRFKHNMVSVLPWPYFPFGKGED